MTEKRFRVTGMHYYENEFLDALSCDNDDYDLKASELSEIYYEGDRIYKLEFDTSKPELIPEPENQYDANAVAVYVGGVKIGYIKSGACSQVKNLLASPDLRGVRVEMGGGKYKTIYEDEDGRDKVERGECRYFADVILSLQDGKDMTDAQPQHSPAPAVDQAPTTAAGHKDARKEPTFKGMMIFCIILVIIGMIAFATTTTIGMLIGLWLGVSVLLIAIKYIIKGIKGK